VTVGQRPIDGVSVAFIDLASGTTYRTTSKAGGAFETQVPAGRYAVTAETTSGLVVDKAPSVIAVAPGQIVAADLELSSVPGAVSQTPPPAPPPPPGLTESPAPNATNIQHDPVGCVVAGQFPLLDARIEPASSVARARIYFRAAQVENWYYVEMTPAEAGFVGKLPRPKVEASPIHYYIQAATTDFGEGRTQEIEAIVVADAKDCPQDKKVAAIGPPGEVTVFSAATGAAIAPVGFAAGGLALTAGTLALLLGGAAAIGPPGEVTVFSAATGAAIAPVGFAAGGLALTAGTLALLLGGAAAIGIGTAVVVNNASPTPPPAASPTPTPSPESTPRPSPSPSPSPTPVATAPPPATPFR
jgi:hypothetical protein